MDKLFRYTISTYDNTEKYLIKETKRDEQRQAQAQAMTDQQGV
jgi:hypothetical protein